MVFLPEKMARISILVSRKDLDLAVYSLLETGSFQPISRLGEGKVSERARVMIPTISEAINRLEQYIDLIGVSSQLEAVDSDSYLEGGGWIEISSSLLDSVREIDKRFDELYRRARDLQERIFITEPLASIMRILGDIDIDLGILIHGKILRLYIAVISRERISRIIDSISKYIELYMVLEKTISEEESLLLIIARDNGEKVREIFRQEKAREIEIPKEYQAIPKTLVEMLEMELNEYRRELNLIREKARKIYDEMARDFIRVYAGLRTAREALYLLARSRDIGRCAVIEGYIPKSRLDRSLDILRDRLGDRAIIEVREISRLERNLDEEPPSKYSIPKRLETFKMISELYGPPSYSEVIPVFISAVTFPLIFGLMFPDLGHGLVLLIAGIMLYSVFGRNNRSYRELGELVIIISIAAMIAGLLSGEFFGPATPVSSYIEKLYEETPLHKPPLAIPIGKETSQNAAGEALMLLIFISLRIGGATLTLATLLGLVNSILERDYEKIFARDLPRFMIFLSVSAPVFAYQTIEAVGASYGYMAMIPGVESPSILTEAFRIMLYAGLAWILASEAIIRAIEHGIRDGIRSLANGFVEFFDSLIILIGNTISYLRIMGIALAHVAIIIAFYQPVKVLIDQGGFVSIPAWVLYAVGNLLDIGLESIVAFAHTLRLHLYEMFGKFYQGIGRPYEPLRPPMIRIVIEKRERGS